MKNIRLGTRKSALALKQAEEVSEKLISAWPELTVAIMPIETSGDLFVGRPLSDIGGKGLFTKEIEEALLDGRIDLAVHSIKDMQTLLPDTLTLGCILEREDPRDVLIGHGVHSIDDMPHGATFGTSSLRRSAQLKMRRPDVNIVPLRGNVQTRLSKIASGEIQFTMLARAGLNRLGLFDVPGVELDIETFLPAVAQGAIGIECRQNDKAVLDLLSPLADIDTEQAVQAERAFLQALDGSCRTPIAGYAVVESGQLHLRGMIIRPDGSAHHAIDISGSAHDGETLGREAGEALLAKAGKDFLA